LRAGSNFGMNAPVEPEIALHVEAPPPAVQDLADACCRFVLKATNVDLDYQPETLSLLDHYLEQARAAAVLKPETLQLVARAVGAYFGEVVRRRHASWWHMDGDDPTYWQIQFESVYLAFSPVALVYDGLLRAAPVSVDEGAEGAELSELELEDDDRAAVAARLSELPAVSASEFYAPTTRLEVIDIVVEAIRARKLADAELEARLTADDYEGMPLPS